MSELKQTSSITDLKWLVVAIRWARAELHKYLAVASPILIGLWGAFDKDRWYNGWPLFFVGALAGILAILLQPRRPSYRKLETDYEHLKEQYEMRGAVVERSLETLLEKIAAHCGVHAHQDRISAYYYHDGQFVMIGRQSKNPAYRTDGRRIYPVDQGAIGRSWASPEGEHIRAYPADREKWLKAMMRDGLMADEAAKLTMQSRKIAAIRISDSRGSVGVLVFETTRPKNIGPETLAKIEDSLVYEAIGDFIGGSATVTPKAVNTGAGDAPSLFDQDWKRLAT